MRNGHSKRSGRHSAVRGSPLPAGKSEEAGRSLVLGGEQVGWWSYRWRAPVTAVSIEK